MNIQSYLEVTKLRSVALLTLIGFLAGVVGYNLNSKTNQGLLALFGSTLAVAVACMGTNTITNYIDRDIDAVMLRTKNRPIPLGKISPPGKALSYGIMLISLSLALQSFFSIYGAVWIALGMFFDIIAYNVWLKRRSPINVLVGSIAGGAPVMAVWSSTVGEFWSATPILMASLVVLWTPIHIWSLAIRYSDDYAKVNVPMFPVVAGKRAAIRCIASASLLLVLLTVFLFVLNQPRLYLILPLTVLNITVVFLSSRLLAKPTDENAWLLFKFSSPYLALTFIILSVSTAL